VKIKSASSCSVGQRLCKGYAREIYGAVLEKSALIKSGTIDTGKSCVAISSE